MPDRELHPPISVPMASQSKPTSERLPTETHDLQPERSQRPATEPPVWSSVTSDAETRPSPAPDPRVSKKEERRHAAVADARRVYDRDTVTKREFEDIQSSRENRAKSSPNALSPEDPRLIGLALSGGGIRAATFHLGLIQAFARLGILPAFDYISAVSGGAYIASWLSKRIYSTSLSETVQMLSRHKSSDASSNDLQWLRQHSSYLTPRLGMLGTDTGLFITTYLYNLFLSSLVMTLFLSSLLLCPRVMLFILVNIIHRPLVPYLCSVIGGALAIGSILLLLLRLLSDERRLGDQPLHRSDYTIAVLMTIQLIASILLLHTGHTAASHIVALTSLLPLSVGARPSAWDNGTNITVFVSSLVALFFTFIIFFQSLSSLRYFPSWPIALSAASMFSRLVNRRWQSKPSNRKLRRPILAGIIFASGILTCIWFHSGDIPKENGARFRVYDRVFTGWQYLSPSGRLVVALLGLAIITTFTMALDQRWLGAVFQSWGATKPFIVIKLLITAGLTVLTCIYLAHRGKYVVSLIQHDSSGNEALLVPLIFLVGVPCTVAGATLCFTLLLAPLGRFISAYKRELVMRLASTIYRVCLGWLVLTTIAIYGPYLFLQAWARVTFISISILSLLVCFTLSDAPTDGPSRFGLLRKVSVRCSPYIFLGSVTLAVAAFISSVCFHVVATDFPGYMHESFKTFTGVTLVALSCASALTWLWSARIGINTSSMHMFYQTRLGRAFLQEDAPGAEIAAPDSADEFLNDTESTASPAGVSEFPGLPSANSRTLNQRRFAAGGTSEGKPEQGAEKPTALRREVARSIAAGDPDPVASGAGIHLEHLTCAANASYSGPYLILNAAMNLARGDNLAWQERKATNFIFSPLYCGYQVSAPIKRQKDGRPDSFFRKWLNPSVTLYDSGYRATSEFAYGSSQGVRLAHAMAISGSALNPNMGSYTSPRVRFLHTLFNLRLGWWFSNPRYPGAWNLNTPRPRIGMMVDEFMGYTNDHGPYVNLSDGGHFEGLGLYELVNRRCRIIVVSDACEDAHIWCRDLGHAIERCRADFGYDIRIDVSQLQTAASNPRPALPIAVGTIRYSDTDVGILIYVKAVLTDMVPLDVVTYAKTHNAFPHESTFSQWFTESQFEAYRMLGFTAGEAVDDLLPGTRAMLFANRAVAFAGFTESGN